MKASSKRYCLTPGDEFYLIGYGPSYQSRLEPAKGVHDDIYAAPLLIEADGREVFIFNADFIEFEEEMAADAQKRLSIKYGIPENHVLLSATHDHSSVMDYHKHWSTGKFSQSYYEFVMDVIEKAYVGCHESLETVDAYYGTGIIEGYYGSRIHLGEEADNEVILVEFRNKDGKVVASICNWATHSTVISPEHDLLTADFAGNVRTEIAKIKGYYPAMIVGAAGDSSNRAYRKGTDFAELERISKGVAGEIAKIKVDQKLELTYEHETYFRYRVHYHPEIDVEETNRKIAELEKKQDSETSFDGKKVYFDRIKSLKRKLTLNDVDRTLYSTIINLGELEIVTIPGELGSRFGKDIKRLSKAKTCIISGYTNGHYSYLLQPEVYGLSFETLGSVYRPDDVLNYVGKIIKNL